MKLLLDTYTFLWIVVDAPELTDNVSKVGWVKERNPTISISNFVLCKVSHTLAASFKNLLPIRDLSAVKLG